MITEWFFPHSGRVKLSAFVPWSATARQVASESSATTEARLWRDLGGDRKVELSVSVPWCQLKKETSLGRKWLPLLCKESPMKRFPITLFTLLFSVASYAQQFEYFGRFSFDSTYSVVGMCSSTKAGHKKINRLSFEVSNFNDLMQL